MHNENRHYQKFSDAFFLLIFQYVKIEICALFGGIGENKLYGIILI